MEELAIKISIYDRQYPMKVHPKEETMVREAAKAINDRLQGYKNNYHQIDIQDLLSMVVLDTVVANLKLQKQYNAEKETISTDITSLVKLIDEM
jgi:cell division protein ZapA